MTSEIRANTIKNRVGLGTVSYTNTGIVVSGIVTANSFSGPLTSNGDITGTGDLTLTSIDAGSSAAPIINLFRNSASPADADYLGQIKFQGESDTGVQRNYAKITGKILDVTNGSEDGILEFAHIKGGAQTITGRWRSDSLQLLNGTNLTINGDLDVDRHTNLDNVSIAGVTTFASGNVQLASDSQKLQLGSGQDLWMYHTGTSGGGHGLIQNEYGTMYMLSASWEYRHYGTNQTTFKINANGNVTLYYQGSGKLSSTSTGAQIDTILRLYGAAGSGGGRLRLAEGAAYSEIRGVRNTDTSSELWFGTEIGDTVDYRAKINTGGHFIPGTDSTYDLGLTGTRWRNLYADTLYGDGSNLTGITQTTINNNANNRLITGSGTANTLEAEAAITFYNSGSDPILTIENSGNPQIRLRTTGTTDACTIDFGDGDSASRGRIAYINNGDNLLFYCNGVTGGEKMKLYSDGRFNISPQRSITSDTMLHVEAPSSVSSGETNVMFEGNATMGARLNLKNNDTSSSANNQINFVDAGGQSTSSIIGYNTDQTNNYGELVFGTRNAQGSPPEERMRISKDGNVSIGTQNTGEGKLYVNGDITAKQRHGSSDMYGMLAGRKFDGTSAMGGYAIRYGSGYESPWIVGYNAGSSYDNQITFGSMTTSDRSLATGVQKRMVIDMASGKVGINSTTPFQTLDVKGSINGGTVNQPFLRFHDSHGDQRSTKHYFKCVRGSTTIFDIVTVDLNQNFHQALIILYYGARLQAISDSTTYPVHKIIGVNRFNGGNIQFTKNTIVQNANVANHGDIDAVAMSSTQYRIRLTYSGSTGGSSFCCGSVEIIGVGSGTDGAFYSLAHSHGLVA